MVKGRAKADTHRVSLCIDSRLDHLPFACLMGRKLGELGDLDDATLFNIELCVSEVVANCIRHGYGGEPGHRVEIGFKLTRDELVIQVWDRGRPVPVEERSAKDISFDEENLDSVQEGGRGVFLLHTLMTSVEYCRDGERNVVRLKKTIEPSLRRPKPALTPLIRPSSSDRPSSDR